METKDLLELCNLDKLAQKGNPLFSSNPLHSGILILPSVLTLPNIYTLLSELSTVSQYTPTCTIPNELPALIQAHSVFSGPQANVSLAGLASIIKKLFLSSI